MNCEELVKYLSDFIENELDDMLSAEAKQHIATCPKCHILLDTTEKTITLCQDCAKQKLPLSRRKKILEELQQAIEQRYAKNEVV